MTRIRDLAVLYFAPEPAGVMAIIGLLIIAAIVQSSP
jgi:hypothetical protein